MNRLRRGRRHWQWTADAWQQKTSHVPPREIICQLSYALFQVHRAYRFVAGAWEVLAKVLACLVGEMKRVLLLCIKIETTRYDLYSERAEARSASRSKTRSKMRRVRPRGARDGCAGPRVSQSVQKISWVRRVDDLKDAGRFFEPPER